MNNYICDRCGARLDPGERCECAESITALTVKWSRLVETDDSRNGQLRFNFNNSEVIENGVHR